MSLRTRSNTYQVMVDIETTGVHIASGSIWQIGAVDTFGETFECTINPSQFLASTASHEPDTLKWQQTSNRANWENAIDTGGNQSEAWLVQQLFNWVRERRAHGYAGGVGKYFEIYSKGGFDFAFLHAASKEFELGKPWHYREEKDLRSISDWCGVDQPKVKSGAHNALNDAIAQMHHLQTLQQYHRPMW